MRTALTPHHLVTAARVLSAPALGGLGAAILVFDCSPGMAAAAVVATALVLMQAAPRLRAGDLLGGIALFATLAEWLQAGSAGAIDAERWQVCIVTAAAMMALLKVQHWRGLARQDAYVPLRQLERRRALFGRTRGKSAGPNRSRRLDLPRIG